MLEKLKPNFGHHRRMLEMGQQRRRNLGNTKDKERETDHASERNREEHEEDRNSDAIQLTTRISSLEEHVISRVRRP